METSESIAQATAQKQFTKEQPQADLRNFIVKVTDHPKEVEVLFAPEVLSWDETDVISIGGRNRFGCGITYFVDKATNKIVRSDLAK